MSRDLLTMVEVLAHEKNVDQSVVWLHWKVLWPAQLKRLSSRAKTQISSSKSTRQPVPESLASVVSRS